MIPTNFYRFRLTGGYIAHLFKSVTRQDHLKLKPIISAYLPPDGVAIDVGAHGGQVTRLLADIAHQGLVIAVEPSGYTRSILRLALFIRGYKNVVITATALGASAGAMLIRTPIKGGGDMGYGLANLIDGGSNSISEPVAVVTLDSLVDCMLIPKVDFIKADIEGFEANLMNGATGVLKTMRPAVYMEMDDGFLKRAGSSLNNLWMFMIDHGYIPHNPKVEGSGNPIKINQPTAGDIFWLPAEKVE